MNSTSSGPSLRTTKSELGVVVMVAHFFFQAEDGIRDLTVTGVQTCALPISLAWGLCNLLIGLLGNLRRAGQRIADRALQLLDGWQAEQHVIDAEAAQLEPVDEIGRASCRERV